MRMSRMFVLLGTVIAVGAAGCGDDKPSRLSTGVDGSKTLGTATPAEADAICKSTQIWAKQAIAEAKQRELTCRVTGIGLFAVGGLGGTGAAATDDQLRMACKSAYESCMMAPTNATSTPVMCQQFPAGCMATVAEYEACLNDVPAFVDQTAATLPTCDTVNQLSVLALLGVVNGLPATCKTFQMKCPVAGIPGIPGIPSAGAGQP